MAGRIQLHRWFAIAAALILVATAGIHGSGYTSVSAAVAASSVNPALGPSLRAVWLMISFHLVILAAVAVVASGVRGGKAIVLACALLPAVDTIILFRSVGVFIGTVNLGAAAILLVASGLLHPADRGAGGGA